MKLVAEILWGIALIFAGAGAAVAPVHAHADDETPPWQFSGPTGRVGELLDLYPRKIKGYPDYQERVDAEIQENFGNMTWGSRVTPWIYVLAPYAEGGNPKDARVFFELKEGWVEHTSPLWDVRVGNQIVSWGAADQINPTDLWNPRDFYDPFQSTKLPFFTAKIDIHPPDPGNLSLQLLFSPLFRENKLPVAFPSSGTASVGLADSRWLLPLPSTVVSGRLTAPLFYEVSTPTYPESWQAGARLQVLRLGGWDFSASYLNAVEKNPRFYITSRGSADSPNLPITITLNPSFHRMQMLGADGAGSLSIAGQDFGLRLEGAYVIRDNSRALQAPAEFQSDLIKANYAQAVVGVDHTFTRKILGTVLYANAMFVYYQEFNASSAQVGQNVVQGLPNVNPWDRNYVLYLESRITPKYKITNTLLGSFQNGDALISPAFQAQLTDSINASLGGDLFVGPSTGFFGQFGDNRRVVTQASWLF
jgi:hypothetical protein